MATKSDTRTGDTRRRRRCTLRWYGAVVTALALAPLALPEEAHAEVVCTVTNTDDSGTGSLRECLTVANGIGGDIDFEAGLTGTITLGSQLVVSNTVSVLGPGADLLSVKPATQEFRVFVINSGATVTLSGLTITGGLGDYGGAIHNSGALTVASSTLSGNIAVNGGGAIANYGALTVASSTLTGNTCDFGGGGGIISWGDVTLTNSTLSGNTAGVGGGGILTVGSVTVTNSTITDNHGGGSIGGGLGISGSPTVVLRNTLVAGNEAADGRDIYGTVDAGSSFNNLVETEDSGGLVDGVNGNQVLVAEPGLGVLGDNGGPTQTVALLPGSPAIGAASAAYAPETDQRGMARDRSPDVGAFEVTPQPDALISTAARSGYIGNNVYNTTGARQTRRMAARQAETRTFYVRVVNDGTARTAFTLWGSTPVAGSRVRYFTGTTEITQAMRSKAGWQVTLARGRFTAIEMRITVRRTAATGTRKPGTVTARWTGDPLRVDLVKGVVRVAR